MSESYLAVQEGTARAAGGHANNTRQRVSGAAPSPDPAAYAPQKYRLAVRIFIWLIGQPR
jgi:hypothetical protein